MCQSVDIPACNAIPDPSLGVMATQWPILLLDQNLSIVYANKAFCSWKHTSVQTLLYQSIANPELQLGPLPKELQAQVSLGRYFPQTIAGQWLSEEGEIIGNYTAYCINIMESGIYEIALSLEPKGFDPSPLVITQKKQAEQLYLLTSLPYGACIVKGIAEDNPEVLWANVACAQLFGSQRELQNILPILLQSANIKETTHQLARKNSRIANATLETRNSKGKKLYLSVTISPAVYLGKQAFILYLHDISASYFYQERLFNTEQKLRLVTKNASVGQWKYIIRNNKIEWSPEVFDMLGISVKLYVPSQKLLAERINPDDLEKLYDAFENAIHSKVPFQIDLRVRIKDSGVFRLRCEGEYHYNISTRTSYIIGVIQDVTEKYVLEKELKLLQNNYKLAHQIAKIGLWEWHIPNNVFSWTESFAEICKWTEEASSGSLEDFIAIIHPSEREKVAAVFQEQIQLEHSFQCTVLTKDEERKTILIRYQVVESNEGVPIRIAGIIHDITDSKQAENELKYHKYLSQNVTDAIISTNIQMKIKTWNKAAENIYGWKASEVIGRRLKDVLFSSINPRLFDAMSAELIRTGEWKGQLRQANRDSRELIIQSSIHLLKDKEGYMMGLVMVNRDLTDFMRIEQEAFRSQQMLDLVFDNMPGHIYWVDPELLLLGCNPSFAKHLNINFYEDIGHISVSDFDLKDSYKEEITRQIKTVLSTGRAIMGGTQYVQLNGEEYWFEVSYIPIHNQNGDIIGVLSTNNDATDKVRFQKQMEVHRRNLHAMVENAGYALCYLDTSFALKAYNQSFEEFHQDLFIKPLQVGSSYLERLPNSWKEQVEEVFLYVLAENSLTTERELMVKDEKRWFEISCNPVMNNEKVEGLFFSIKDITQRKIDEKHQVKKQLRSEQERSLAIIQGQEEERRRVSMELHDGAGQILTALQMQSNILEAKISQQDIATQAQLQKVIDLAKDAKREIRRISFNLMPSMLQDFGLIPSVEQLCSLLFPAVGIKYHVDILISDSKRYDQTLEISLFRIIQEIFNNAVKYSKASNVSVKLSEDNGELRLSIVDDGIGIEQESINMLKQKSSGLNNIKQRINLLNGSISIKTAQGEGVKYAIHLPIPVSSRPLDILI